MDVQQELKKLDELREALIQKAKGEDYITSLEKAQPKVRPGTKAHELLLAAGYDGMTKVDAETIIKERDAEPERWPYAEYKKAKNYLAALGAKSQVISTRKPWRVRGHSRVMRG